MLFQCWQNIKSALGDCTVFAVVLLHCYAGAAFLSRRQNGHFPDNMIHWPDADVMLGHRLQRWANIISTKTR